MRRILSNQEERRLSIIELLSDLTEPITYKELASRLESSQRTISDDIDTISEIATQFTIHSTGPTVELIYKSNQNIQTVYRYFLSTSKGFMIINEILKHGSLTLDDLVSKLNLSRSTLYRLLSKMNIELKERYSIEISFNPFKFIGKEIDIRYFLTQFITERYFDTLSEISWLNIESLDNLLIFLNQDLNTTIDYTILRTVKHSIIINAIRLKQGFYEFDDVEFRQDLVEQLLDKHPLIREQLTYLFKSNNVPFEVKLVYDLFKGSLLKNYYYSPKELLYALDGNPTLRTSYNRLKAMLHTISEQFTLSLPNEEDLIYYLFSSVTLYKFVMNSSYILYDAKGLFVKDLVKHHPSFVDACKAQLVEYLNASSIEYHPDFLNHLIYILYTHWENLSTSLYTNGRIVKALIISAFDINHALMVKSQLTFQFSNRIHFDVYTDALLDFDSLSQSDYDIIIGNYPLPKLSDKHTLTIRSIITIEDTIALLNILNEMFDSNPKEH